MPQATIQQISMVRGQGDAEGVRNPGAFTTFDDNTAVFCGNGGTTPAEIASHYLDFLARNDTALQPFRGIPAAGRYGAQFFLQQNQHIQGLTIDRPVPTGELFHMDGVRLKDLLAPFAKNLDTLREHVASMSAGGGDTTNAMARATGNVRTQGRTLPPF